MPIFSPPNSRPLWLQTILTGCALVWMMPALASPSPVRIAAQQPTPETIKQASGSQKIMLQSGIFDPLAETLDTTATGLLAQPSQRYGLVQFKAGQNGLGWLRLHGLRVLSYVPNNAYLVRWNEKQKQLVNNSPVVRYATAWQSDWKVAPALWPAQRAAFSAVQLDITAFADYDAAQLPALVHKLLPQARILRHEPASHRIAVEINTADYARKINALAASEGLRWITQYQPLHLMNTEAVSAVQANAASGGSSGDDSYTPTITPIWDKGLIGSGQIVAIADSGLDHNEDWFAHYDNGTGVNTAITNAQNTTPPQPGTLAANNKVVGNWVMPGAVAYDNSSFSYHGTHVSGSVAGDRLAKIGSGPTGSVASPTGSGYDNDDGMAPNAQILFQDIGGNSGLSGQGGKPMFEQAYAANAKVHSNSYGATTLGEYVASDAAADAALRELENMLILFAAGNDDGQVNSTSSPGNAKNVLTVGALGHGNSTSVAFFSNKGPTDDGRLKPDIATPGTSTESAAGNSDNSNTLDTTPQRSTKSGTSMATPTTAGAAALMRQYFTDGFYPTGGRNPADAHEPTGPLMKAVLLNGTGIDSGFFENDTGWGRTNLSTSLMFADSPHRLWLWEVSTARGLKTGETETFDVNVEAGQNLRATLAWYDVPGPLGTGKTLVNDLNLTVSNGSTVWVGNAFSGVQSVPQPTPVPAGNYDSINTVEGFRLDNATAGTYSFIVTGNDIPGDGSSLSDQQGFALVVRIDGIDNDLIFKHGYDNALGVLHAVQNVLLVDSNSAGISVAWDNEAAATAYEVYRADGTCATANPMNYHYIGTSPGSSYVDTKTIGGFAYAYKVRAKNATKLGPLSACVSASSQQACPLPPVFDRNSVRVVNNVNSSCQIELAWDAATATCPLATGVRYNLYRSSQHDFQPSAANFLASTAVGATSYIDTTAPAGTPVFYKVIAEDDTTAGTGPNNGNPSQPSRAVFSTAVGPAVAQGNLVDDADNLALMQADFPWQITSQQASNGTRSYHSAEDGGNYPPNTCARLMSPPLTIPANPTPAASLVYQARYNLESNWDGVVVEISTDGGNNWADLPPTGGYPGNFSQTGNPPINACGYAASHGAFNGSSGGAFSNFSTDLSAYHGQTVLIRWSLSSDPGTEEEGYYLDQVQYKSVLVPSACVPN